MGIFGNKGDTPADGNNALGANPRFVVTNLERTDRHFYDRIYRARGDMENRIKDQQLRLCAGRAFCHRFRASQFRQLLGLAYAPIGGLRRLVLSNKILAPASPDRARG